MVIRLYDLDAKFGVLSESYCDYECDNYQVVGPVLHLMRTGGQTRYVPLTSIKIYHELPPIADEVLPVVTDSMLEEQNV